MKLKAIVIALLGIIYFYQPANLSACTCMSSPPIYETFNKSEAVFVGKVVNLNEIDGSFSYVNSEGEENIVKTRGRIYRFELIETFKGPKGKFLDVNLGEYNPTCQSRFTVGESYLVYATKDKKDNYLRDGVCSRSVNLESAMTQIEIIREKIAGKPEAKIYGAVVRSDNFPDSVKDRVTKLENITVILQSEQKRFETKTDKRGIFKFNNEIPDGVYTLSNLINSNFISHPENELIKVENGKFSPHEGGNIFYDFFDSLFTGFYIGWNNEVKGKIFDGEGKPVKYAAVRFVPVADPFGKVIGDETFDEDENGDFWEWGITPGKYFLVAEIFAPFGNKNKVRIFYPQSESPEKAVPIEIKSTSKLNFDIILPLKFVLREIKGKVIWSDGQPAPYTDVRLHKTENHSVDKLSDEIENIGFDRVLTDEFGDFTLLGFEGVEYWIHFENTSEVLIDGEENEVDVKAKPLKIKVQKENQPLKIILPKPEDK